MILKVNSGSNSKQAVRALRLLLGVGVGDSYNAATQAAVKAYQKVRGLSVDGIAWPKTLAALCGTLPAVSYLDYSGSVHVKAVQALVGAKIDGKYGKQTRANVTAFQSAAGIAATPAEPGFRRIVMAPVPDKRLGHLEAEYASAAGPIKSAWHYEGDRWIWEFSIPEGASAAVTLPGATESKDYGPGRHRIEL